MVADRNGKLGHQACNLQVQEHHMQEQVHHMMKQEIHMQKQGLHMQEQGHHHPLRLVMINLNIFLMGR